MQTRWCRVVDVGDDTREAAWQLFDRDDFAAAGFTALA